MKPNEVRDPDPWRNASAANEHAYKLQESAHRTKTIRGYARAAKAAAEAFEVAADAWETVGDLAKADIRRASADHFYREAFVVTHDHLSHGHYVVSDREARSLVERVSRNVSIVMPTGRTFYLVRISPWGRLVELHRTRLNEQEVDRLDRKRPWVYTVTGVR